MREGFNQQLSLGCTPIESVEIPLKMRSHMAALLAALQYVYVSPKWNQKIFELLYERLQKGKKQRGRKGMGLWELFVLGQVRLCMNTSYDELHFMANDSEMLRGIMGVLPTDFSKGKQYEYQNIYDNVGLLDDTLLQQINDVIVAAGHDVFKKKESAALCLKTDSYVVETDTHFPTDYNLLWDSARKCIKVSLNLSQEQNISGWRKSKSWLRELKGLMRSLGKVSSVGGKNKADRLEVVCQAYLLKACQLSKKVKALLDTLQCTNMKVLAMILELEYYHQMLDKHIDLVERRLLKGESIPHQEKVFSIFQPYTEFIKKGKLRPNVEIGKKLFVTTDQYHLIVDYQIGNHQNDNELTISIADRLLFKYGNIQSLSVDKGFSAQADKQVLEAFIPEVIMPKKGRRTQKEKESESSTRFKKLKNKHSSIESNINELEHRGLDRCPDRTWENFKNYIGLGISAYNLHKIGRKLQSLKIEQAEKDKQPILKKAS